MCIVNSETGLRLGKNAVIENTQGNPIKSGAKTILSNEIVIGVKYVVF